MSDGTASRVGVPMADQFTRLQKALDEARKLGAEQFQRAERATDCLRKIVEHWDGYDESEFADEDKEGVKLLKLAAEIVKGTP